MIAIYYTALPLPLTDTKFVDLLSSFPKNEQRKILSIKNRHYRSASLVGKVLLWEGLKNLIGNNFNFEIKADHWGRPHLKQELDFNITHTGSYIAVAILENNRLGIDIEEIKPINLTDFQNYFHKDEWTIIQNASDPQSFFFDYWTAKEAIIKADGRGLHLNLADVKLQNKAGKLKHKQWQLRQLKLFDDCKLHIAYNNAASAIKLYPVVI